jgi:hypothetical protein
VFQPDPLFSYSDCLRGLYFSFILALTMRRVLLLDFPSFERAYDSPEGIQWKLSEFRPLYEKGSKDYLQGNAETFRTSNIFGIYLSQFLVTNRTKRSK